MALVRQVMRSVVSFRPSVYPFVCFHLHFWTAWLLTVISCVYMCHDRSSPPIENQGHDAKVKCYGINVSKDGDAVGLRDSFTNIDGQMKWGGGRRAECITSGTWAAAQSIHAGNRSGRPPACTPLVRGGMQCDRGGVGVMPASGVLSAPRRRSASSRCQPQTQLTIKPIKGRLCWLLVGGVAQW